jgi:hypothetical protein
MKQMVNKYGSKINVVEHIILKNGWEYYVTDDRHDENTVRCVVMGFETEFGDVYMPELKGYIVSRTRDLSDLAPATGYEWVA